MSVDRNDIVREAFPAYKRNEEKVYTVADYMALPDDRRCELIDGVLYDMAAPGKVHQAILTALLVQIKTCIDKNDCQCIVYPGPIDVQLDCDEYTMVQPDLMILCREDDPDVHAVQGAPDFVVEIVSPSNRSHDTIRKFNKYKNAHVRELWLIDPELQKIQVHCFEKDFNQSYSLDAVVEVEISEGKCKVNFSEIMNELQRFFGRDLVS